MKISKKELKGYVRLWITIEIVIAFVIIKQLGLPGLAKQFCERFPLDDCAEIDWEYYGYED